MKRKGQSRQKQQDAQGQERSWNMGTARGSMSLNPRLVVSRAEEARRPSLRGQGAVPEDQAYLCFLPTHLCLCLATIQPPGPGTSLAAFDQKPGAPH